MEKDFIEFHKWKECGGMLKLRPDSVPRINLTSNERPLCLVPNCQYSKNHDSTIHFFKFPNSQWKSVWLSALRIPPNVITTKTQQQLYCCQNHFNLEKDTMYYNQYIKSGRNPRWLQLKPTSIPQLYDKVKDNPEVLNKIRDKIRHRDNWPKIQVSEVITIDDEDEDDNNSETEGLNCDEVELTFDELRAVQERDVNWVEVNQLESYIQDNEPQLKDEMRVETEKQRETPNEEDREMSMMIEKTKEEDLVRMKELKEQEDDEDDNGQQEREAIKGRKIKNGTKIRSSILKTLRAKELKIEIMKNKITGRDTLLIDGYRFKRGNFVSQTKRKWKCTRDRSGCKVEAITEGSTSNVIDVQNSHNHNCPQFRQTNNTLLKMHGQKQERPTMKEGSISQYKRFKYSEEALFEAVRAIKEHKISLNRASKKYSIPKSTLSNKVNEKVAMERKMGPSTILSKEEEANLSSWIIKKAKAGFPLVVDDLKDSIQKILEDCPRANPFKDNRPGGKWVSLFLKRHPEIKTRNADTISKARASVTKESIVCWFGELNQFLDNNGCWDLFDDPRRILNCAETGCLTCPSTGTVLGPKVFKNRYEISSGKEKESITVLCTYSADGSALPPMVVYPYKQIPTAIITSMPTGWAFGRSDSGWMVSATFYEYITKILKPWLDENKVPFPVVLFLDGHKSHLNLELSIYCAANKIFVYCLPPNATHIIQPCDVSIFRPLKLAWRKIVQKSKEMRIVINTINFAGIFNEAFDAVGKEAICNGFRACGLYPLDKNAVDYSKCISERRANISQESSKAADCNIPTTAHAQQTQLPSQSQLLRRLRQSTRTRTPNQPLPENSNELPATNFDERIKTEAGTTTPTLRVKREFVGHNDECLLESKRMYLLSLLPDLRDMTEQQKEVFKSKIYSIIHYTYLNTN